MMKILVVGSGFIASHLPYEIINDRLLPSQSCISSILAERRPDVIVNCIGKTGKPNIDWCDSHKEETIESNLIIPSLLANECARRGIRLVSIGSGCIFYGESRNIKVSLDGPRDLGWREQDSPRLENASFYSKIKYACDLAIGSMPHVCSLRIRMPISSKNSPRNLINKLLSYKNVLDTPNSVTFMDDLVRVIDWIIVNNKNGIYHVANPEPLTHIQLLEEYKKYHPEHKYNIINEKELKQFIIEPRSNCILDTSKLKNDGFVMTPSQEALANCMRQFIVNK